VQAISGQLINVVVEYLTNRGLINMLEATDILQIMALIQDAVAQALAEHVATYHQEPSPEH
jgi:hypothetical protein